MSDGYHLKEGVQKSSQLKKFAMMKAAAVRGGKNCFSVVNQLLPSYLVNLVKFRIALVFIVIELSG